MRGIRLTSVDFPDPGPTDNCERLTAFNFEVNVLKHWRSVGISKIKVSKFDLTFNIPDPPFYLFIIEDFWLFIKDGLDSPHRRCTAFKSVDNKAERNHRTDEHHEVGVKRDEIPERHFAADDAESTHPKQDDNTDPRQTAEDWEKEGHQSDLLVVTVNKLSVQFLEMFDFACFKCVRFHNTDTGQILLYLGV